MFDLSMGEIAIIGVVGLVVLGPERLPVVARTIGSWVRKAKQTMESIKSGIGQDFQLQGELDILKQELAELKAQGLAHLHSVNHTMQQSLAMDEQTPPPSMVEDKQADVSLAPTPPTKDAP